MAGLRPSGTRARSVASASQLGPFLLLALAAACGRGEIPPGPLSIGARVAEALEPHDLGPASVRVLGRETALDHQSFTLEVSATDGAGIPVQRLSPLGDEPRPGILLLHGHDLDGRWWTSPEAGGLALRLVELGFEVLMPDLRSFGAFAARGHYGADGWPAALRAEGDHYVRVAANDARRVLALLREDPEVTELAVMGQSLGAWLALVVATVEPDVDTLISSGLFLPFDVLFSEAHHDCQHMTALAGPGDAPAWVAELLGRARVQIHWGEQDPLYPLGGPEALDALRGLASEALEDGRLEIRRTPGLGHALEPEAHLAFLRATSGR